jgi:hypothetical protein
MGYETFRPSLNDLILMNPIDRANVQIGELPSIEGLSNRELVDRVTFLRSKIDELSFVVLYRLDDLYRIFGEDQVKYDVQVLGHFGEAVRYCAEEIERRLDPPKVVKKFKVIR